MTGVNACKIDGCEDPARTRGWCKRHYLLWYKHGDPEHRSLRAMTASERFWLKVDKHGPVPAHAPELGQCWQWTGSRDRRGYGRFKDGEKTRGAHVVVYEAEVGPIPDGHEVDHLCRNTPCVRPSHLEAVTPAENMRRRKNLKTRCPQGHEYTAENSFTNSAGYRQCRTCRRAVANAGQRRRRAAAKNNSGVG